jgi:NAD(P)-dependent dehydrogenase (short-subunit alcohol dehydrogenase family)
MLLADRVCIITGAASSRGIGRATARLFALHGGRAIILDLDAGASSAAAEELGGAHRGYACDVTDRAACEAAVGNVVDEFGRVDVLINNAGITQPVKFLDIAPENYDAVLDVNLRGTLYMSQAAIPHMQKQKSGSIVCMSSVSAQRGGGIFGGPHYSAAKGGVLGLAKAMAREFGPDNIRVNSVTPGLIQTDITGGKLTPEMMQTIVEGIPMGRAGEASDVAGCALFLASDLSAYCTGTEVDVNGGSLIH